MNRITDITIQNIVNYDNVKKWRVIPHTDCDVNIIVPVRGRSEFMTPLLDSLCKVDRGGLTVCITVVEHSGSSVFEWVIGREDVNYIHVPCETKAPFNKCLCMNIGAFFSARCDYYLFHDLDLLVNRDFLINIFANLTVNHPSALQTFNKRRVLFCDGDLTTLLVSGERTTEHLSADTKGVYDRGKTGAPGGSIIIDRNLFFIIGGYDPELWHSYSPEDLFFWDKMNLYTNVGLCENPINEVYHLDHPLQQKANPEFGFMSALYKEWTVMSEEQKIDYCEYKAGLISKYK